MAYTLWVCKTTKPKTKENNNNKERGREYLLLKLSEPLATGF